MKLFFEHVLPANFASFRLVCTEWNRAFEVYTDLLLKRQDLPFYIRKASTPPLTLSQRRIAALKRYEEFQKMTVLRTLQSAIDYNDPNALDHEFTIIYKQGDSRGYKYLFHILRWQPSHPVKSIGESFNTYQEMMEYKKKLLGKGLRQRMGKQ